MRKVPRAIQTMSGLSVSRLDGSKSASAGTTGGEGVGNLWKTASAMPHLQSLSRTHGRVLEPEDRAPVAFHVEARARRWTVVDMKRDWRTVFRFEDTTVGTR